MRNYYAVHAWFNLIYEFITWPPSLVDLARRDCFFVGCNSTLIRLDEKAEEYLACVPTNEVFFCFFGPFFFGRYRKWLSHLGFSASYSFVLRCYSWGLCLDKDCHNCRIKWCQMVRRLGIPYIVRLYVQAALQRTVRPRSSWNEFPSLSPWQLPIQNDLIGDSNRSLNLASNHMGWIFQLTFSISKSAMRKQHAQGLCTGLQ